MMMALKLASSNPLKKHPVNRKSANAQIGGCPSNKRHTPRNKPEMITSIRNASEDSRRMPHRFTSLAFTTIASAKPDAKNANQSGKCAPCAYSSAKICCEVLR